MDSDQPVRRHAALEGEVKRDIDAEANAPLPKEDAVGWFTYATGLEHLSRARQKLSK